MGPTVDDRVNALADQPGHDPSDPTDVTLGGHPAKRIELVVEAGFHPATCDDGFYRLFLAPGEALAIGQPELFSSSNPTAGQRDVMYVLDLAGTRWLLWTWHDPDASEQHLAELDAMLASIAIDPPSPSPSSSSSPKSAA